MNTDKFKTAIGVHCRYCGKHERIDNYCPSVCYALKTNVTCHSCNFWLEQIKNQDHSRMFIYQDDLYFISLDIKTKFGNLDRGFGGDTFVISFGEEKVLTNNLWHLGKIPTNFVDQFTLRKADLMVRK